MGLIDKKAFVQAFQKVLEGKGNRKFLQSAEIAISMRGIDFTKSENRLNLDVVLPRGKGGKAPKIAVIADDATCNNAKKAGAELTILPNEIPNYTAKERITDLADNYMLLAQPNLMGNVAKSLGQYLGPRGKLPRPIVGDVVPLMARTRNSVRIASKGKYLPAAHAFIGTENMSADELGENADSVFEAVKAKVGEGAIKNVYVKLTMSAPVKV